MINNAQILVGIGAGLGTLLLISLKNRRDISNLKQQVWGPSETDDDGMVEEHACIREQLDRMESKMEQARVERDQAHREVQTGLMRNRYLYRDMMAQVLEELSDRDELKEIDMELEDVEPLWFKENVRDGD